MPHMYIYGNIAIDGITVYGDITVNAKWEKCEAIV